MPLFDTHPVNLSGNWLARSNRRRVVEKQFLSVEDNCFCLAGEGWDYLWFANAPTFSRRRSFKMVVGGQILHQIKIVFQLSYDFDYAQRIFNVRVLSNPRKMYAQKTGKLLFKSYIYYIPLARTSFFCSSAEKSAAEASFPILGSGYSKKVLPVRHA